MKRALILLALLSLSPVSSVFAQTTFSYEAKVTSAFGQNPGVFSAGDTIIVTYTLDPGVADTNVDSQSGIFPGAVVSLSVSFPGSGISVVTGAGGTAQTFDNVAAGFGDVNDQAFFQGGPISAASMLGGAPIESVEVDFLSAAVTPPAEPTMLTSDALPVFQLPVIQAFVILNTSHGATFVNFELCPNGSCPEPPYTCAVNPTFDAGTLTMNFTIGASTPAQWHVAFLAAGNVYTLFKTPIPVVSPAASFPVQRPLPQLGTIGVLSTLTTASGLVCTDLKTVDTGSAAAARQRNE